MIRPGRDTDGAGFAALIGACWREFGDNSDVRLDIPEIDALPSSIAARGGTVWTAELAGQVVGMVATYPATDGWHISRMYVAAGQRGTGLARDLLRTAEDHARAAEGTRMVLWSDVLFTRAHAFYEKHGYLRRGGLRPLNNPAQSIEAGFAKPLAGRVVEELDVAAAESAEQPLATILQVCAESGAPVPFVGPLDRDRALDYWRGVTRAVGLGQTRLFAAWRNGELAGAVQLGLDMPETGRHRAEIRTLVVAPGSRCRGLARRLLEAAETAAREAGRTLLVLETRADEHAEPVYQGAGWMVAGTIPGYALDGAGTGWDARIYYKRLA